MIRLNETNAKEIDEFLRVLLIPQPHPIGRWTTFEEAKKHSEMLKSYDDSTLRDLIYISQLEQKKEGLPEMFWGDVSVSVNLVAEGRPIKDFLRNGGFSEIWSERAREQRKQDCRYYWQTAFIILGIAVTYGVSQCNGLSSSQHQSQAQRQLEIKSQPLRNDSPKMDAPKTSSKIRTKGVSNTKSVN